MKTFPRLVWLFVALLAPCAPTVVRAEKPNILLIMADDLGIEGLGCYGGDSYKTPRLDQLAAGGMRFTHAYSQPLCTPTRVQIMTGKYNHRNWLYFGVLDPGEKTFGHLLQQAGYKTCIAGKWQLQSYDPPDFPNALQRRNKGMRVTEAGFDEYSLFHSWHTEDKGSRYADPTFFQNGQLKTIKGGYGPDADVEFILDFMRRHQTDPQFIYYPMSLPHWPMQPTPDSTIWSDPDRRLDEDTKYFPDMVRYMDKTVGQLVDGIERLGLRDRTLILFYSDNGTDTRIASRFGATTIQGGKASPLQTGIRVPLIANAPGTIDAGQTNSDLIDASDFLPTLAEWAGAKLPADWGIDGVSFAKQLIGANNSAKRESCFFWYDPRPGWDKERFSRHIFALDHRFKLYSDGRFFAIDGVGFKEELVQLSNASADAKAAHQKLKLAIKKAMQPPTSAAARKLVDAYGDPIAN